MKWLYIIAGVLIGSWVLSMLIINAIAWIWGKGESEGGDE